MNINDFLQSLGIAPQRDQHPSVEIEGEWLDPSPDQPISVDRIRGDLYFTLEVQSDFESDWKSKVVIVQDKDISVRMSRDADYVIADILSGSFLVMSVMFLI